MKSFSSFLGALALFIFVTGAMVFAAAPAVEGTPVPTRAKPDFSSMQFLVGSWTCSNLSSRRPGPFTTTEVYSMDPNGYWMLREDTTQKASWIPTEQHGQTVYTWDAVAKNWVRISTSENGGYTVATAPAPTGSTKTYTYVIQSQAPDIASYAPEVYSKDSATKKSMTTSFTEAGGRVVTVKQTCTKS
jgi:hypothetical protein